MQNKEEYLIKFYSRVTEKKIYSIDEIPEEVLLFLSHLEHNELVIPFVTEVFIDRNHKSLSTIMHVFKISESWARRLGERAGTYKPQYVSKK